MDLLQTQHRIRHMTLRRHIPLLSTLNVRLLRKPQLLGSPPPCRHRTCHPPPTPSLPPYIDGILTATTVVSSASAILLTALCCPAAAATEAEGAGLQGSGARDRATSVRPGGGADVRDNNRHGGENPPGYDEDNLLGDDDEDNLQWAVASLTSCIPLLSFVVRAGGGPARQC